GKVAAPVINPLAGRGGHFRRGAAHNGHHRGCADAERVVRILHQDSHREALRQPHPIEIPWHIRQATGAGAVLWEHSPAWPHDLAAKMLPLELKVNLRRSPLLNVLELALAEIGYHIPRSSVH